MKPWVESSFPGENYPYVLLEGESPLLPHRSPRFRYCPELVVEFLAFLPWTRAIGAESLEKSYLDYTAHKRMKNDTRLAAQ